MKGKTKRLIAGLVLLGFGIAIMSANATERTATLADELVETTTLSPENEGKLVMVAGTPMLEGNSGFVDEDAGLKIEDEIYSYNRNPQMKVYYESREKILVERKTKIDGRDIEEMWDVVRTMWGAPNLKRDDVVISGIFRSSNYDADGEYYPTGRFINPDPIEMDKYSVHYDLYIGEFKVSILDIGKFVDCKYYGFSKEDLEKIRTKYSQDLGINFEILEDKDGCAFLSTGNEVGDLKVEMLYQKVLGTRPVTIIGRQRGDSIVVEEEEKVSELEQVQAEIISKKEFLDAASKEDTGSRYIGMAIIALGAILTATCFMGKKQKTKNPKTKNLA